MRVKGEVKLVPQVSTSFDIAVVEDLSTAVTGCSFNIYCNT